MGVTELGRATAAYVYRSKALAVPRLIQRSFGKGYAEDVMRHHMAELPTKDTKAVGMVAVGALVEACDDDVPARQRLHDLKAAEASIDGLMGLNIHVNGAEVPEDLTCLRAIRYTVADEAERKPLAHFHSYI